MERHTDKLVQNTRNNGEICYKVIKDFFSVFTRVSKCSNRSVVRYIEPIVWAGKCDFSSAGSQN